MFKFSPIVSREVLLQVSPQLAQPYASSGSTVFALRSMWASLSSSALFGGVVFAALALYSFAELALADGAAETSTVVFTTDLRASAMIAGLATCGFFGTLMTVRKAWGRIASNARLVGCLTAVLAILFVLGMNTRGPIAYAVGMGPADFLPLGLVLLALGMSMALMALKLGQLFSEAMSPLDEWSKVEQRARKARRLRFAESLVQAAQRPASNVRKAIGRGRQQRARALPDPPARKDERAVTKIVPMAKARSQEIARPETAGLIRPLRPPCRSRSKETLPSRRARGLVFQTQTQTRTAAFKRPRRSSTRLQQPSTMRSLFTRLHPYLGIRGAVDVIATSFRRLARFSAASLGHKAAQPNLPLDLTGCGQEKENARDTKSVSNDRDGLGRQAVKEKRSRGRADRVQGKSLQGTLFRVR